MPRSCARLFNTHQPPISCGIAHYAGWGLHIRQQSCLGWGVMCVRKYQSPTCHCGTSAAPKIGPKWEKRLKSVKSRTYTDLQQIIRLCLCFWTRKSSIGPKYAGNGGTILFVTFNSDGVAQFWAGAPHTPRDLRKIEVSGPHGGPSIIAPLAALFQDLSVSATLFYIAELDDLGALFRSEGIFR